jgi:hypothetical protein
MTDRQIEDLRVALIRAINTALGHAGVDLPASAAATVEPSFGAQPVPPEPTHETRARAIWEDWLNDRATTVLDLCRRIVTLEDERDEAQATLSSVSLGLAEATARAEGLEVERDHYRRAFEEITLSRQGHMAYLEEEREKAVAERDEARRECDGLRARTETGEHHWAEWKRRTDEAEKDRDDANQRADQNYKDLQATRLSVRALEEWRDAVTAALQRPDYVLFADVPGHVRELVRERKALKVDNAAYWRRWSGLDVEREKWAALARENDELARRVAELTTWRPMSEARDGGQAIVSIGSSGEVVATRSARSWSGEARGWLPIPEPPTAPVVAKATGPTDEEAK